MRRVVISIFVILFPALSVAAEGEGGGYRVGVVLPLTGRAASVGAAIRNGFELGLSELSPAVRERIVVRQEDDGSESSRAVSAYQKFKTEGVDVVITAFSNAGNAVAPLAEGDPVTHLAVAFDESIAAGRAHTVQVFSNLDTLAPLLVEEAERRGYKRIAVVNTAHEGNVAMRRSFEARAKGRFELIDFGEVLPAETDFRTLCAKLKQTPHDAVASFLHPAHSGLFVEQARKFKIDSQLFGYANLSDKQVIETARGGLEGSWYVDVKESERFLRTYAERFPSHSRFCAVYGYDAALLVGKAVSEGKPAGAFRDFLRSLSNFEGGAPGVSSSAKNGLIYPAAVYEIRGGQGGKPQR